MSKFSGIALASSLLIGFSAAAADYHIHTFKKIQLSDQFWSEGANYGDFNRDGHMDVVSGPYWYEGPDFKVRHQYYPANESFISPTTGEKIPGFEGGLGLKNAYSDNFFTFVYDFNHDGWPDILVYGFPGKEATWYENPKGREGHWQKHVIFNTVDNESPAFTDINGDGKPDIVCNSGGYFGYATADWEHPEKPWTFHPITPKKDKYGVVFSQLHSVALADMDGDGLMDIVTGKRFWAHGHNGADPGSDDPAVIYWFKLVRHPNGQVEYVPHLIDTNSGVGTQVVVGNIAGSKYPDIVVGNKKGTFVFINEAKRVSKAKWEKAQPKPMSEDASALK
jgi:hypothetical protein